MNERTVLQAVRLKGSLHEDESAADAPVKELTSAGLLPEGKAVRLSLSGRHRLTEWLPNSAAARTCACSHTPTTNSAQ